MTSSGNLGMVCGVGRPMHERDDAHRIRQAEMAQEIAELTQEVARLKRELQAAKDAARPRKGDEVSQWMKLWGQERNRVIELQDMLDAMRAKAPEPAPPLFWLGRDADPATMEART